MDVVCLPALRRQSRGKDNSSQTDSTSCRDRDMHRKKMCWEEREEASGEGFENQLTVVCSFWQLDVPWQESRAHSHYVEEAAVGRLSLPAFKCLLFLYLSPGFWWLKVRTKLVRCFFPRSQRVSLIARIGTVWKCRCQSENGRVALFYKRLTGWRGVSQTHKGRRKWSLDRYDHHDCFPLFFT